MTDDDSGRVDPDTDTQGDTDTDADTEQDTDEDTEPDTNGNTPPVLVDVALSSGSPREGDTLQAIAGAIVDADGDSVSLSYAWFVNDVQVASGTELTSASFNKHDSVFVEATPSDGRSFGTPVRSSTAVVLNTAPVNPADVEIGPTDASIYDDLSCEWTASTDADGDTVRYEVTWIRDGVEHSSISADQSPVALFAHEIGGGEVWGCEVQATDGDNGVSEIVGSSSVSIPDAWTKVVVSEVHSCGIASGRLFCWGDPRDGQTGIGPGRELILEPTQVGSREDWVDVVVSTNHSCAITDGGELYCWGFNGQGALGDGTTENRAQPTRVGLRTDWKDVSLGSNHSCGTLTGGALFCWGDDGDAALGQSGVIIDMATAPILVGTSGWDAVGVGDDHSCGLRTDGHVFCWGNNTRWQVGIGSARSSRSYPVRAPSELVRPTTAAITQSGVRFGCALSTDGAVYCWGDNDLGQLGDGTTSWGGTPGLMGSLTVWTDLAVGASSGCVLDSVGALLCWGNNADGQLGNGTTTSRTSPGQSGTEYEWVDIWKGYRGMCGATRSSGTRCWGNNDYGQLGDGTTTSSLVPIELPVPE